MTGAGENVRGFEEGGPAVNGQQGMVSGLLLRE
jgi:hypothetical protein